MSGVGEPGGLLGEDGQQLGLQGGAPQTLHQTINLRQLVTSEALPQCSAPPREKKNLENRLSFRCSAFLGL